MKLVMCHYPGCTKLSEGYYCEVHKTKTQAMRKERNALFKGTERRESKPYHYLYESARWRAARKAYLVLNPYCTECGERATIVDHILPHHGNEEAFFDCNNWQGLCQRCHSAKTLRERDYFHKRDR